MFLSRQRLKPEPPELPIPVASGDVIGGGPSEDAEAVARIDLLLNDIPGDYQVTGQDALAYAKELSELFPTLGPAFDKISIATDCAFTSGVIGAKAYLAPDLRHAGATVIVSGKQLQNLGPIALDCLAKQVLGTSLPFGGGEEGFDPCFDSYQLDALINGVTDRYYVFTAGTNPETCQYLRGAHMGQGLCRPRSVRPKGNVLAILDGGNAASCARHRLSLASHPASRAPDAMWC